MKGAGCNHELVLTKEGVGLDSSTRKGGELSYTVVERSCRSLVGTARSTTVVVSGNLECLFVSYCLFNISPLIKIFLTL